MISLEKQEQLTMLKVPGLLGLIKIFLQRFGSATINQAL
jgi:hypothetical protein